MTHRTFGYSAGQVLLAILLIGWIAQQAQSENPHWFEKTMTPLLQSRCVKCHGADPNDIAGDIDFSKLSRKDLDGDLVRTIIDVLDFESMPPEDEPELESEVRSDAIEHLTEMLHEIVRKQSFAAAPIRRMNRFQYNNAVVDLFDLNRIVLTLPERMMRDHDGYFRPETGKMASVVKVGSRPLGKSQMIEPRLSGVAAFPQDLRAEHGFDNRGDHLSLSPLLMESFLRLGQSITQSPEFAQKNVGIWKSFFAAPKDIVGMEAEVRGRIQLFLNRAFRGRSNDEIVDRYVQFVMHQLDANIEFSEAMKSVAAATIASPRFLYLYDSTSGETASAKISDLELATRLSIFLWGSIPDDELLELAAAGKLSSPEILEGQIDRMLKDRKLKRFCDSFPAQWLQLERIISSVPDRKRFPDFYFSKYRDSMHMMLEPLLLFETVLIENQPITQLIDPDFTYRSKLLENAYGELGTRTADGKRQNGGAVAALTFKRVPITDRRVGGIVTNAAVMTMTSGPERTKPITRGAWIATVLFNDPPEPPPADVPPLTEEPSADEELLTLRERLALHRQRADCRGCHEQIDPLGFALENFDAVGAWREHYDNGREIDPAGVLFRKQAFQGVAEFKDALVNEKDRFTRALAGHLLSYAVARELDASDQVALDGIVERTIQSGYKFQVLIKQVLLSQPFLSKTAPSSESMLTNLSE